jgi:Protein of unknown function (DUF1822)
MMSKTPMAEQSKLTITLSIDAHTLARQVAMQQFTAQKAKQSYLDTLARYAVNFYLQCVGIETKLQRSDDSLMVSMMDITDVELPGIGKLECRVVLPGETTVKFPEEVWCDRIGYMAVQVNEALTEAEILGFVKTVKTEEVSFDELRSTESFLTHLHKLEKSVKLYQWLSDRVEQGWETLESIFSSRQLAWRSFPSKTAPDYCTNDRFIQGTQRGKKLSFSNGEEIVIILGLTCKDKQEVEIYIGVGSAQEDGNLPEDLQCSILDRDGEVFMQTKVPDKSGAQLQFKADIGDEFGLKLDLPDESLSEFFVIY